MIETGLYSKDALMVFQACLPPSVWLAATWIYQDPDTGEVLLPIERHALQSIRLYLDRHLLKGNLLLSERKDARIVKSWLEGKSFNWIAKHFTEEDAKRVLSLPFDPFSSELFKKMNEKIERFEETRKDLMGKFSIRYRRGLEDDKYWKIHAWLLAREDDFKRKLEYEFFLARRSLLKDALWKDRAFEER